MDCRRIGFVCAVGAMIATEAGSAKAGNPIITSVYTADPAPHVWPGDDRLWLYTTHDEPDATSHATVDYHVFSSTDLVTWIDYGQVLHLKDVSWASENAWATDAVLWKGVYYFVFCAKHKANGVYRTGLATSDRPEGPFKDAGFIQGVEWGQDPAVFIDNGKPYLYWGSGAKAYVAELNDDLKGIIPGSIKTLSAQLTNVYEGPWVHKHNGKYYLSYPGLVNNEWPELMYYATSDNPLGPFAFQGEYMGKFPSMAGTNHGGFVEFKGEWYAFYHAAWVSNGNGYRRNVHIERAHHNPDGSIAPIMPTKEGVAAAGANPGPSRTIIQLEAENGAPAGGRLAGVRVDKSRAGYSGAAYVTGFGATGKSVSVLASVLKAGNWQLRLRYAADSAQTLRVRLNGADLGQKILAASASFVDAPAFVIALKQGNNTIELSGGTDRLDVDTFLLDATTSQADPIVSSPTAPTAGQVGADSGAAVGPLTEAGSGQPPASNPDPSGASSPASSESNPSGTETADNSSGCRACASGWSAGTPLSLLALGVAMVLRRRRTSRV